MKSTARLPFPIFATDTAATSRAPLSMLAAILFALLAPIAHAQTFSVIHTFGSGEGSYPYSGITIKGGTLYGTTSGGGQYRPGSVFQISHVGSNWLATPLVLFWLDGYGPNGNANFGPDGYLYSTTRMGGAHNWGTLFNLVPQQSLCKTAKCFWTENVVHDFNLPPDGFDPELGDVVWDQMGTLYGATSEGGLYGRGTVYQVTKSGNSWTETVLHSFANDPDGADPENGVIFDSNGNLYGTTVEGGSQSNGTVYKLTNSGNGWQETILYNFTGGNDGANPVGGLIFDNAGNLYGTTQNGPNGFAGVVFELSPSGDTWTFQVLANLPGPNRCGSNASLAMDASGNLYGTTVCTGAYGLGTVFELTNTPNGWVYSSVHDFTGYADGAYPHAKITIDSDGTLYGTATYGGKDFYTNGDGTAWMIKP